MIAHAVWVRAALLLGVAGVLGVWAPAASHAAPTPTTAGEACKTVPRPGPPPLPTMPPPLDIFCGSATSPVGAVWIDGLPGGTVEQGPGRQAAIEEAAKRTLEGQSIARRMNCGPAQPLGGDPSVLLYSCTLKEQGWPQIVLRVGSGNLLIQAEGLPSLLTTMGQAIDQAAGRPAITGAAAKALADEAAKQSASGTIDAGAVAKFQEYMRLGRLYNSVRNYPASEDAFRKALDLQTGAFGKEGPGAGEVEIELALAVSHQGRFAEADALFKRAEPALNRAGGTKLARLYAYLAIDSENQGNYRDAIGYARQATALRREQVAPSSGVPADITAADPHVAANGELVHSLLIESDINRKLGHLADAEAEVGEALQLMGQVRGLPLWWRPEAMLILGQVEADDHRGGIAETNLKRGVDLDLRFFGKAAPSAAAYMALARYYSDSGADRQAVDTFRLALEILRNDDTARAQVTADDIGPFLKSASVLSTRDAAQRKRLGDEMFEAVQLMRSSVADQAVANASARLAAGNPEVASLIRDEQEAERARDSARLQLAVEQAKPREERGRVIEEGLQKDIDTATARVQTLQGQLRQRFPAYANFAEPTPVELQALQGKLDADEALIVYVIGRSAGYAMVVRRDKVTARALDTNAGQLAQDVAQLRKAFLPRLGALPEFDLRASYALYQKLMAPLENDLNGAKHLIVAPAGALASLPTGLLVTAPPGSKSYQDAAWLLRRVAISEVPSARAFLELRLARAAAKPAPRPFLGVGNPSFTGRPGEDAALVSLASSCRLGAPVPQALIRALAPLPETAEEVRRVGQRLGADQNSLLLGASATEANLLRQPLSQYNVLYFATHGLLPSELNCNGEPGLALSPGSGQSTSDDGLLEASEIAGLHLNADLVVLSACNTAAGGDPGGGEALQGLADAFFHAGARRLLVSHWEVSSTATVQLMTGVFDHAGAGFSNGLAESLREAQLSLVGSPATAHPFYWAAFTVMGDGGRNGAGTVASN